MVNFWAIVGCSNRGNRENNLSFFRLPKVRQTQGEQARELSEERQRLWLSNISRSDLKPASYDNIRICSAHFIKDKPAALFDKTNSDWAPTLKLGHEKNTTSLPESATQRYDRQTSRTGRKRHNDAAATLISMQDFLVEDKVPEEEETGAATQTDLSTSDIKTIEAELQRLQLENMKLKEDLSVLQITEASLVGKNDLVNYLTGLQNHFVLKQLLIYVNGNLQETHRSLLTKFQQVLLTLMKLRLNVSNELLAFMFRVSQPTVSRTFLHTLDVLYMMLERLITWPTPENVKKTMPMEFRRCLKQKVAVIIDCFEVFIEKPSNLDARRLTFSSYKHHNTVKFLIGITPQGTISFLSKAWGGRVSDKFLTEHSGFLDKLLPGDVVLADRGFDVAESVGLMMATVSIPAFTKGKSQMPAIELEKSRKLAHLRIHVERVIGLLRQKFTLLSGTLPITYLITNDGNHTTTIDKVAVVCSALINLCETVVPLE